ncbi:MAG: RagB/SusD family nutrient uptake outer membrane protein [Prolixibacteraceae bacterium]
MKKLIIFATFAALFTSCSKWLEIAPKSEIASNILFESEQGFKDALMGSYLLMTSQKTFGFESTVGFVDNLAQQYYNSGSTHPYYYEMLYQYDVTSVINRKDNIWSTNYNAISNLNNIIENIELKKSALNPVHYAFIRGESLGLRAFLHFDLLRLFSYGNLVKDPSGLTKIMIPYVTKYTKQITPPIKVSSFIDSIKNDLNRAAQLLAPYDSLRLTANQTVVPNSDQFYDNRNMRFNYYAVKALQARLYLWIGDYDKAILAANEVITRGRANLVSFHGGNINDPTPKNKDYTFSSEHIFALNVQGLYDIVWPYIRRYASDGINTNYNKLYHNGTVADNLFEIATKPQMSLSDYRYKELYNKVSTTEYLLLKFTYVEGSIYKDKMPLIKLPEMYYILAEAYNEKGSPATAIGYLNMVRINRGIASSFNLATTLSQAEVTAEIEKEYRKEFISEGQLFYFYKRIGKTSITGSSKTMDNTVYILPLPQKEIEMGGR